MDSSPSPGLPNWVRKRDGSTQPFDADKINRALFAATESVGRPDAFVARELTDGVLHFLLAETENGVVTAALIADTLVKVVRELGQPQLAAAFAAPRQESVPDAGVPPVARPEQVHWPTLSQVAERLAAERTPGRLQRGLAGQVLASFSLERVFSRNLVAAHQEGLLILGDLDTPAELAAAVIRLALPSGGPGGVSGVFEALEQARQYVGRTLACDAPERELAQRNVRIGDTMVWVRELCRAARTLGLEVVLNLGCETPPAWAAETTTGPLFAEQTRHENQQSLLGHLDVIVDHVLQQGLRSPVRIDWHLTARDFDDEMHRRRLLRLVRTALGGAPIAFVCDRPRREVSLAEGLDRNHQAVLQWVGLDLPTLLRRQARVPSADAFVAKVLSLARLAASAGVQKREFLRKHGRSERPAFVLDQAHLGLYLVGLHDVAGELLQQDPADTAIFTPFASDLTRKLEAALAHEERTLHLRCLVDDPPAGLLKASPAASEPADAKAALRQAGKWHGACGRGSTQLPLPADREINPDEVVELLQHAWKHTAVNRVRCLPPLARQRQMTAQW